MKYAFVVSLISLASSIMVFGCASSQQAATPSPPLAPKWVMKTPGDSTSIYGVGVANIGSDAFFACQKAEDAARQEVAKLVVVRVKNLMDAFLQQHQDFVNMDSLGLVEFTQSVSRAVGQAALSGSLILEDWQDKEIKMMYALATITKMVIVRHVRNNVSAHSQTAFQRQKTDDALRAMDRALASWNVSK
ncbi:MAG: hypothetical protein WBZ48_04460 [Bacteroidota bacterium]